jgi:hypothetical protein
LGNKAIAGGTMSDSKGTVGVPISVDVFNEFSLRCGESTDPAAWIDQIVRDFLDRTRGDADIWSSEHARMITGDADETQGRLELEPTEKPKGWKTVFLPSGTRLRLSYEGKRVFAEVKWGTIGFSASDLSSAGAVDDKRNHPKDTWRDLWVRLPENQAPGKGWTRAVDLRETAR